MIRSNELRLALLATCAAGLAFGGLPARAQTSELPEIVVTAQKRSEVLFDVPLAIVAVTGAELEKTGVRDLTDLFRSVPGASQGRSTTGGNPSFQIRGVSSYFGESTVGYYLDDAAFSIPNRNIAPVARTFDVERVEVLRGPQGTLYGVGSMGGTVRFITADPDLNNYRVRGGFGVSNTEGGENNHTVDLAASIPLIKDKLAVRLTGSHEKKGGYAESPSFPGDPNSETGDSVRAKVLFKPTDNVTLKGLYQHSEVDDHWGKQLNTINPDSFLRSTAPGRNRSMRDMYSGYAGIDFGPVLLESTSGYIERNDRGFGPLKLPFPGVITLTVDGNSEIFSQEVRLVSQSEGPWKWIAGVIYQDAENVEGVRLAGGPPRNEISTYGTKSYAVFGEVSREFMDGRLIPLVGLRYFTDERDFLTVNRVNGQAFKTSDTFESVNPRFNLSYKPSEDALIYANIAKGFRSGTFNTQAAVAAAAPLPAGLTVDPDSLWSYEVGTKLSLLDNRLKFEASVYYFKWSDQQLNFSGAGNVQIIVNGGEATGRGLDYGVTWATPVDGLILAASGNFNSTEYSDIQNPAKFVGTGVIEGRQIASVPESSHTVSATYTRPMNGAGLDLYLNGSYSYISRQGDPTLTVLGDDHNLLKLRGGFSADKWGAYIFGDNVLDDDGAIQISGSGTMRYYPRVVGVEVTYDF